MSTSVVQARESFLELVAGIRPELHRYCARLTGSVIEGEDLVQETLARGFYALGMMTEAPPLRPWLFRIAHHASLDFLKSHGHKLTEPRDDLDELAQFDETPDPIAVRAALARFLVLPATQRNAVILKDVLGHSLEETAETMETTVLAVKAALVRGRAGLREEAPAAPTELLAREKLDRYAALFNARDWDGVRALVAEDCRLDLVSKAQRRGKQVHAYYGNYAKEDVRLAPVRLEGHLTLAAFVGTAKTPSYFVFVEWDGDKIGNIRDFRYVPYIADEAVYELV